MLNDTSVAQFSICMGGAQSRRQWQPGIRVNL